jgi:hypothetical protein
MATKCKYNWHDTGRQVFFDGSTYETLHGMYPVSFYDDFTGADVVIPATGADESGCKWTKKIVGAAPPTVGRIADGVNSIIECAMTSASQKQDAAIHMDDELGFSIAQGAIFECRLNLSVLPTLNGVASWGLWGAWADGGSAYRVGFEAAASGAITCECDDNATDTATASGVTVLTTDWKIYRIDCTTQADIKFFIDGVRVAASTTFNNAASAANSKSQPHVGLYKASGAGLGKIQLDYVKVLQNRS